MIPDNKQIYALHKKYAHNEHLLDDVFKHCEITAEIAVWCAKTKNLRVNEKILHAGCMLHDIGSYVFLAANEKNRAIYPQHAIFGSALLQEEGVDKRICEMVKTHVLLGLSKQEIIDLEITLPYKNFEPTTLEARLLCYADRFSSKGAGLVLNSYESFLSILKPNLPMQAKKFEIWAKEFGIPNTDYFAKKYNCTQA